MSFYGGTLMTDRVRYRLPFGYFGWLIANYFVKKEITQIFEYRREYVSKFNV